MRNIISKYVIPLGAFNDSFKVAHTVFDITTCVKLIAVYQPTSATGSASITCRFMNDEEGLPYGIYLPVLSLATTNNPTYMVQAPGTVAQMMVKPTAKNLAFYRQNSASSCSGGILHMVEEYDLQFIQGQHQ